MPRRIVLPLCSLIAATGLAAGSGCAPPILSVDDAVTFDGKPVMLVAYAERPQMFGLRSDIERVALSFHVDGREVGCEETGEGGRAAVVCQLPRSGLSDFEVRATVDGRQLRTTGHIFTWQEQRPVIAVDIDHTVCHTDYDDLILRKQDGDSRPIPGAREALAGLCGDFHIAYVTGRPRLYVEKTRRWLNDRAFPAAPVVTAPRLRDVIRQKTLKRRMLAALRERWPALLIGIGNNRADADAYGANGMLALVVNPNFDHAYNLHAIVLGDWAEVDRFFAANRDVVTAPDRLERAIRGELALRRRVVPWREREED